MGGRSLVSHCLDTGGSEVKHVTVVVAEFSNLRVSVCEEISFDLSKSAK